MRTAESRILASQCLEAAASSHVSARAMVGLGIVPLLLNQLRAECAAAGSHSSAAVAALTVTVSAQLRVLVALVSAADNAAALQACSSSGDGTGTDAVDVLSVVLSHFRLGSGAASEGVLTLALRCLLPLALAPAFKDPCASHTSLVELLCSLMNAGAVVSPQHSHPSSAAAVGAAATGSASHVHGSHSAQASPVAAGAAACIMVSAVGCAEACHCNLCTDAAPRHFLLLLPFHRLCPLMTQSSDASPPYQEASI
jgi:hypothetical protein